MVRNGTSYLGFCLTLERGGFYFVQVWACSPITSLRRARTEKRHQEQQQQQQQQIIANESPQY